MRRSSAQACFKAYYLFTCIGLLALTTMPAWSNSIQQHDAGGHSEHQKVNWWGLGAQHAHNPAMGWSFVTFGIFVLGVAKTSRKRLAQYLHDRAQHFEQSRAESAQRYRQAQQELAQQQQQLQQLPQEIEHVKTTYQQRGQQQKQLLIQQGQEQAQQLAQQVERTIVSQAHQAQANLQKQWIQEILKQTEQKLASADSSQHTQTEQNLQDMLHADLQHFHSQEQNHG